MGYIIIKTHPDNIGILKYIAYNSPITDILPFHCLIQTGGDDLFYLVLDLPTDGDQFDVAIEEVQPDDDRELPPTTKRSSRFKQSVQRANLKSAGMFVRQRYTDLSLLLKQ